MSKIANIQAFKLNSSWSIQLNNCDYARYMNYTAQDRIGMLAVHTYQKYLEDIENTFNHIVFNSEFHFHKIKYLSEMVKVNYCLILMFKGENHFEND